MKNWKAGLVGALSLASVLSAPAWAQEHAVKQSEVPEAVMKAFSAKYPKAKPTGFEKETAKGKTEYEVTFEEGGKRTEVSLAPDGTVLSEEQRLSTAELPADVQKGLAASKYAHAKVIRAEKELKGGATTYEVVVEEKGKKEELVFDSQGKLLKSGEEHASHMKGHEKGQEHAAKAS